MKQKKTFKSILSSDKKSFGRKVGTMFGVMAVCIMTVGTIAVYGVAGKTEVGANLESKAATVTTTTAVSDVIIDYQNADVIEKTAAKQTSKTTAAKTTTKKSETTTAVTTKKTTASTTTKATTKAATTTKKTTAATTTTAAQSYYGTVNYTAEEFDMLCYVLQNEVGSLSENSKLAVANVILNRVKSSSFPNTITGVLTASNQFTAITNYYSKVNPPTQSTINCAQRALNGEDNSCGAVYYYAPQYCGGSTAQWFESLSFCMELDGQRFFK